MKVNFCLTLNPQKVTNKSCQALYISILQMLDN